MVNTYFKLSYFFISFLYNSLYKIKLSPYENDVSSQIDDNNIRKLNEQYYLLDSMEENIEFGENLYVTKYHGKEYRNMKILNQAQNSEEMLDKIKNSLDDDNLKVMLNFSYEDFLSKESERESK